jgi:DNA polymerase III sliding clamp (beta) subunit (PCNA family)
MRYKWRGADGQFPDYEKLIPTEAQTTAHLDTVEAGKAIASLKALADSKSYPIDLHLNGGVVMSSPDDKGEVTMPADIEGGEVRIRIDGGYLTEALKACGGMVDLKLTDGKSPVLFIVDGYQLVVMPMLTGESQPKAEAEAKPEETEATEPEPEAETEQSEPEAETEKPKRSRKKEKVAVA